MDWSYCWRFTWYPVLTMPTLCISDTQKNTLDHLLKKGDLANGYIIDGQYGSFLRHTALYMVQHFLGDASTETHPDIHHVETAPKKITVDRIRKVQEHVKYGPHQSTHAFVLIHDAHLMTTEAANAFLKTLEEAPDGVCFLLLTAFPYKLLPTIRSRCQMIHVPPVEEACVKAYVEQTVQGYDDLLEKNHHNPLFLLNYLEHGDLAPEHYTSYAKLMAMDLKSRFVLADTLAKDKTQISRFLLSWINECHHQNPEKAQLCDHMIDLLQQLDYNINTKLHLEALFLLL